MLWVRTIINFYPNQVGGRVDHIINKALRNMLKTQKKYNDIFKTIPEEETADGLCMYISKEVADAIHYASKELYKAEDEWRNLIKINT